ncbi:MAG: HAD-IB family phosphatase [Thermodesulfobacteriota bacterium]
MSHSTDRTYVFSDFDGTITAQESLEAVFQYFLPGQWEPVKARLLAGQTTLREGVRGLIEAIPARRYPEILEFVSEIPVRPGLAEFLDFLDEHDIPFVVVSGGIRGMVETGLGHLVDRVERIVAVDVDTGGPYLKVRSDYENGDELVAKRDVMAEFDAARRVVIGDGVTDFNMVKDADLVFARDSLAHYLDGMNVSYEKWGDFVDVKNRLRNWLTA